MDVTVGFGGLEEGAAKLHPFRIFEVRDVFRADGGFPKFGVFQLAHQAGAGAAADKIEAFPPFAVGAFVEQEIAGRRKPLIVAERPPLREVVVDLALDRDAVRQLYRDKKTLCKSRYEKTNGNASLHVMTLSVPSPFFP